MAKKPKPAPDGPFAKLEALREKIAKAPVPLTAPRTVPRGERATVRTTRPKADDALRDVYAGVTPLSARERGRVARATTAEPAPAVARSSPVDLRQVDVAAHARLAALVAGGVRFDIERDESGRLRVQRVGEDRNVLRALTRGALAVDGELDLHGMTSADAEAAVVRFVRRHARDGARAVRIVHGKGLHSAGGQAVLADVVLHALTEGGAAPVVRAIATPNEAGGGTGAVLVALGAPR